MIYEIRMKNKDGKTWSAYTWTDVAENAFNICSGLRCVLDEEFAVFKSNKEVKTIMEATRK